MATDLTYVTAFFQNINNRKDRSTQNYIDYAKDFLETDLQKIVFVEHQILPELSKICGKNTCLIPTSKYYLSTFRYTKGKHLLCQIQDTEKATIDYCKVISAKTFMVKEGIEMNPFQTEKFIWVDFGLRHVFHNKEQYVNSLHKEFQFRPGKVKISGIWKLKQAIQANPFTDINWFFAGGVFGGYSQDLLDFANMCDKQFKSNADEGKITLEVNMWFQIYLENHHRIEWVDGQNFGPGLLLNF